MYLVVQNNWRRFAILLKPLLIIAAGLPIVAVVSAMATYGLNIPFYDQWDISLEVASATADGRLSLGLLLQQHGDHRILFTNMTTALVTALADWDLRIERLLLLLLVSISAFLLLFTLYRQNRRAFWWSLVPIMALLFAVRGRQTFLVSYQSQFVHLVLFATCALVILHGSGVRWRALIAMALLCVAATFSVGSGVVVWIAMLPALWLRGYRKKSYFASWILVATGCTAMYFAGFSSGRSQSEFALALQQPIAALTYFVGYLGAVFVVDAPQSILPAIAVGVVGLTLAALNTAFALMRDRDGQPLALWVGLAFLALGIAAVTALGRLSLFLGESSGQPLAERYIIHSALFWVALIVLMALNLAPVAEAGRLRNYGTILTYSNLVFGLVLSVLYIHTATQAMTKEPFPPRAAEVCYREYVERAGEVDCFWQFYPPMFAHVPERIALYETHQFAGASSRLTQLDPLRTTPDSSP
jgi:hypothetical protein